jgi:cell division protein FtsB
MKVKDLIAHTQWSPGRDYTATKPAVSVLMPTFRRGSDGTFWRAAHSVLGQSLTDLELILVDDGSRDGTADQIAELMRQDGRVSVLTHPENIGLPAIAEYEAYLRTRSDYIAFGFDDFIFERESLLQLWVGARSRPGCAVHGSAEWLRSGGPIPMGAEPIPLERLSYCNFLLNGSFLVPRAILDDVGLYDPHVLASRLCDWDLWRRIHRRYPIERLPIAVGREHGEARNDSLGRTQPLLWEAAQEYFARPRDHALRPDRYPEFDLWHLPGPCSAPLTMHLLNVRRFYSAKGWARDLELGDRQSIGFLASSKTPIVGVWSHPGTTTALMFDGLHEKYGAHLLFIDPAWASGTLHYLSTCDAVIVVRDLLSAQSKEAVELCRSMQIPLYYAVDDNFAVPAREIETCAASGEPAVSAALQAYAGILCSSPALQEYFQKLRPALQVMSFGPVFDEAKLDKVRRLPIDAQAQVLHVGFIGGEFRGENLRQEIVPALRSHARHCPLRLFTRLPIDDHDGSFPIATVEFPESFDEFLVRWRRLGLHILVHGPGRSPNMRHKASSHLLIALYLGAVPVVCEEEAYRNVGEDEGVLKVDGSARSWEAAIARAASAELRTVLLERLERYCRKAYSPAHNGAALTSIMMSGARTDVFTWLERYRGQVQRIEEVRALRHQLSVGRASETMLNQEVASLRDQLGNSHATAATLNQEIASLQDQMGASRASEAALKQEIASLRDQVGASRTSEAALKQEITSLRDQVGASRASEAALRAEQEVERTRRSYRLAMGIRKTVNAARRIVGWPTS